MTTTPFYEPLVPYAPYIPPLIPPTVVAFSPPALPMFPPQGVVQPGAIAQGGGALPASVVVSKFCTIKVIDIVLIIIGTSKYDYFLMKHILTF